MQFFLRMPNPFLLQNLPLHITRFGFFPAVPCKYFIKGVSILAVLQKKIKKLTCFSFYSCIHNTKAVSYRKARACLTSFVSCILYYKGRRHKIDA